MNTMVDVIWYSCTYLCYIVYLTESGDVYVWGGGSEGQLGLEGKTESPEPEILPLDEPIICIASGYYHTALVTGLYLHRCQFLSYMMASRKISCKLTGSPSLKKNWN